MSDIEAAAEELWEAWEAIARKGQVMQDFDTRSRTWDTLSALEREAWVNVAKHVIQEHIDLYSILMSPDHR